MADRIVYMSVTKGGGIDGRDFTDKGGKIMAAAFDKQAIPAHYCNGGWYETKAEVVDIDAKAKEVLAKLNPVEQLALNHHYARLAAQAHANGQTFGHKM